MTEGASFKIPQGRRSWAKGAFLFGTFLLALGLPTSRFLMSIAPVFLGIGWLLIGNFGTRIRSFFQNRAALVFCSLYLLHLIGLLYTSDWSYALRDIKVKLPLLFYPFLFLTVPWQVHQQIPRLLKMFLGAAVVSSLAGYLAFYDYLPLPWEGGSDPSLFMSNVRLSLMVTFAVFLAGYFIVKESFGWGRVSLLGTAFVWGLFYILYEGAFIAIVTLVGLSWVLLIWWVIRTRRSFIRIAGLLLIIGIPLGAGLYLNSVVESYYTVQDLPVNDKTDLEPKTPNGNPYRHHPEKDQLENGNYVWLYIAYPEMERQWEKRSTLDFSGKDKKGQVLKKTLLRYLTSKGLRKDSAGVAKLTQNDIEAVENGVANVNYLKQSGPRKVLNKVIFEIDNYLRGENPSGNSVTQRIEYLKTAKRIIDEHFWMGVGTGDVKKEFQKMYDEMDSPLEEQYRRRAHNQYVTMLLTFGPLGLLWFLMALFYPFFHLKAFQRPEYLAFFVIILISFLSEDTLENQAGITFFMFFQSLLLFASTKK